MGFLRYSTVRALPVLSYTHAIVSGIPNSFKTEALERTGEIDINLARQQHGRYVKILKDVGLNVIELPSNEAYPDSVFVEDTAIVCNGSALICNPAKQSRKGEVSRVRNILQTKLKMNVSEIEDTRATLDGGDVLFTGKELFVGISSRTNRAGAAAVAKAFPNIPCWPIKIENELHLKSLMTMACPDVICVSNNIDAETTLNRLKELAKFHYQILTVPDAKAANVVFVNGSIIYNSSYTESSKCFAKEMDGWNLKPVLVTEIPKAAGALTCCSILV